jgi:tetratricopeptide (TPR) repeat protein
MFLKWIENLSRYIDRRKYIIVVKKHPLEVEHPDLGAVQYVPDTANVHDLIEACDKVVILNSGTGVLAIAMNKPVIVCGDAYYANSGLAYQANSEDDLVELVHSELATDPETGERFIHYLKEEFYSFGKSHYVEKKQLDGAVLKLCDRIDFEIIRGLPGSPVELGPVPNWIPPASFLFRGVSATQISNKTNDRNASSSPALEEVRYIDAYNQGCISFHSHDYATAIKKFTEAMSLQPDNANTRRVLVEVLLKLGRNKEAIAHLEKAHELLPDNKAIKRRLDYVKHPLINMLSKGKKSFPVPASS